MRFHLHRLDRYQLRTLRNLKNRIKRYDSRRDKYPSFAERTSKFESRYGSLSGRPLPFAHRVQHSLTPPTSCGMVCLRKHPRDEHKQQVLMVEHKWSFGFASILKGRFSPNRVSELQRLVDDLTMTEKELILQRKYPDLVFLWSRATYKPKMEIRFNSVHWPLFIHRSKTRWIKNRLGFPRGRKLTLWNKATEHQESDLHCAFRELREETGLLSHMCSVRWDMSPLCQQFKGVDGLLYRVVYFCADIALSNSEKINIDICELTCARWFTLKPELLHHPQLARGSNDGLQILQFIMQEQTQLECAQPVRDRTKFIMSEDPRAA